MAKLVWRVKLVFESEPGVLSETEVTRIERYDKKWALIPRAAPTRPGDPFAK